MLPRRPSRLCRRATARFGRPIKSLPPTTCAGHSPLQLMPQAELKAALDAHAAANRAVKGLQNKLGAASSPGVQLTAAAAAKKMLAKRKAEEPASRRRASCKAKLQKLATEHVKLATAHKVRRPRVTSAETPGHPHAPRRQPDQGHGRAVRARPGGHGSARARGRRRGAQ